MEKFLVVCLVICMVVAGFAFAMDSKQDAQMGFVIQGNTDALGKVIDSQVILADKIGALDGSIQSLAADTNRKFNAMDDRLSTLESEVQMVKHGQVLQGTGGSGGSPVIVVVPMATPAPQLTSQ